MQSKKNKLIILIPIILVVILGIILICQNNKLKYFKEVTNSTFNLIENISEKTKKIPIINNNYNNIRLNLKDNNIAQEEINANLYLDYANNYLKLDGNIINNTNKIFDGSFIFQDNKTYFDLKNILEGTYEFNYDLTDCDDETCKDSSYYLSDLLSNTINNMKINNSNLEGTIKTLRKTVLSSLDKRYVDKRKITTSNDTYTRYSYILNSYSLNKLITKIDSNTKLKDEIFNIFGSILNTLDITKSNFKEALLNNDTNLGTLTLNVKNNKIKKVTLNLTNNLELIVNINDKNNVIEYKDATTNGTITYNKENNNIIVKLFDNNYNAIDLDMTLKSDRQVIKYGIYNDNKKTIGTLTNTINNSSDMVSGLLNIKTSDFDFDITYEFTNQNNEIHKITDFKKLDDLSEEQINEIITNFESTIDTKIVNKLMTSLEKIFDLVPDNSNDEIIIEDNLYN